MAALDTNVIVRWLVRDDAAQTARVQTLLDARLRGQQTLFIPIAVLLETEWVLRSRYRFDKASITAALDALLSTTELEFENEPALEQALWQFKQATAADFADCLHVALAHHAGKGPLLTFDREAAKLVGAALVAVPDT